MQAKGHGFAARGAGPPPTTKLENPGRRTAAGGAVRSHEQFVEYLLAKAPCGEIERGVIEGMPGRNVVLHYRLGSVGWGCPE
jgi:hypothetical protein